MSRLDSIKNEAVERARANMASQFVDPISLEDLPVLIAQLEKKLQTADSKLNSTVSNKLDSLKRSVDLMDDSSSKLSHLSASMKRIDAKIAMTNSSIANYKHLSTVHNVRENLDKTIKQVEFFTRVPQRVEVLCKLMEEGPGNLREVFLEGIKLESLRNTMMKEIAVMSLRNTDGSAKKSETYTGGGAGANSSDGAERVREVVEQHLMIVPKLMADIRKKMMGTIGRMWDLSLEHPEHLVGAFEVAEMHQEYNDRREVGPK
jgi:hypothetical protein